MIKYLIPAALLGPILLAWGVTAYLFGSLLPGAGSYAGGTEGWGEMFLSLSIMFCIAIWIGALFSWLLVRHGGRGGEEG
ncbi:hypothetical protein C8N43_3199 [Litoreibacter ponti]|uniref:Uncharacterized protein n=1 Tax=Litoreibacter ponti TaxID=1510457 RepID=A0A2T6BEA0_9RHOB|nr:hypothetical protein [Litoreibacter ponti]PTX54385.1 hypothetical protein C8N43_3199 [Litoreibacter ponti]